MRLEEVDIVIKPWYREPWPWLLMLGPFVAIIGCAITIKLALDNFSDQPIHDGAVKRGLKVERIDDVSRISTESVRAQSSKR